MVHLFPLKKNQIFICINLSEICFFIHCYAHYIFLSDLIFSPKSQKRSKLFCGTPGILVYIEKDFQKGISFCAALVFCREPIHYS